jgi:hypothetical protein
MRRGGVAVAVESTIQQSGKPAGIHRCTCGWNAAGFMWHRLGSATMRANACPMRFYRLPLTPARGGKPVCWVRMRPLTGAFTGAFTAALPAAPLPASGVLFLRRALW